MVRLKLNKIKKKQLYSYRRGNVILVCVRVIPTLHEAQTETSSNPYKKIKINYMKHSLHENIRYVFQTLLYGEYLTKYGNKYVTVM
jgi:hypothetical protein